MAGSVPDVKIFVLTLVPALVMTVIGPVAAPRGTAASTSVEAMYVALTEALVPLKTTVVPLALKLAPKMATSVGDEPLCGEKLVTRGATSKLVALASPALPMKTSKGPVVAPSGTTTCN